MLEKMAAALKEEISPKDRGTNYAIRNGRAMGRRGAEAPAAAAGNMNASGAGKDPLS